MVNPDQFPQEQQTNTPQTNIPETDAVFEQEITDQQAAEIAVKGLASWIDNRRANRAEKRANKIERQIEVDTHIHSVHHSHVHESTLDVSTMTRRERKRAMKSTIKAKDAEWDRKTAERKELANSGRGRASMRTKRTLRKQIEDRVLTGESSVKEMHINKELLRLGGHVIIDGETQKIERSRPVRPVVRAQKRADAADRRSLRTIDTTKMEQRAIDKRNKAAQLRQRIEERQQAREAAEAAKREAAAEQSTE